MERLKGWVATFVQRHDFTVQEDRVCGNSRKSLGDQGVVGRGVVEILGQELDA
jgi:hypothetical protein